MRVRVLIFLLCIFLTSIRASCTRKQKRGDFWAVCRGSIQRARERALAVRGRVRTLAAQGARVCSCRLMWASNANTGRNDGRDGAATNHFCRARGALYPPCAGPNHLCRGARDCCATPRKRFISREKDAARRHVQSTHVHLRVSRAGLSDVEGYVRPRVRDLMMRLVARRRACVQGGPACTLTRFVWPRSWPMSAHICIALL